ncbi:histone-lysine N-methyltransferase SETMAR-like [Anastrepha ludens]|uniref:histone-lysine N-methyltransferase SETMAR-like n=1 Tax=Anastrepha ludens TaxID=28586 RepID=UPI0023AF320E|nr:histone-lysine N-methyltransferase SETMAR-like [Anastrepha ludens]
MGNRKVKPQGIAHILKISKGSTFAVLHEHLEMKKLLPKWVRRLLTPEGKQQRIDDLNRCLVIIKRDKSEFLRQYVTMDETWIHHCTSESKRQSSEWTGSGESRPKRPKTQQSAGKVMTSVFWDSLGIIFINYLEKCKTINSDYYCELLGN